MVDVYCCRIRQLQRAGFAMKPQVPITGRRVGVHLVCNGLVDDQALCAHRLVGGLRRVDVEHKVRTVLVHLIAQVNLQLHAYAVIGRLGRCCCLLRRVGCRWRHGVAGG
ncbi:hypothetical protein D3C71_1813280 [compost metagenome]